MSKTTTTRKSSKKFDWKKWALIIGIIAALVTITGYPMRDFFRASSPAPTQIPVQRDEKAVERIVAKPAEKTTPEKPGKNNPNIIVKDKAKVGIVNTGDSAVFKDIKQDF